MFRDLRADEIECRVAQATEKGVSLLLYKDARCDQNILDETVGPMNWQRMHTRDNANCVVSLWDKNKQMWVSKEDTGTESNTEKEKGQASDAFKRACFNWGIGRELYTCPFVWINLRQDEWRMSNGRKQPKTRFYVDAIEYQDGKVSYLHIIDDRGVERYKWGKHDDDAVGAACLEAAGAGDLKELEAIYHKYEKQYKSNTYFINAVTKRKNELSAA
jgi:hypothetical protein